jgi:hypothetical protein
MNTGTKVYEEEYGSAVGGAKYGGFPIPTAHPGAGTKTILPDFVLHRPSLESLFCIAVKIALQISLAPQRPGWA